MRVRDSIHDDRLPNSYYTSTCNDLRPFLRLEGNLRVQVCIVGGGFTGVAAAVELAERGYSVALVEQNFIGWGASGRNGGQILGGYGPDVADYEKYEKIYGRPHAKSAWSMGTEGVDIIRQRVQKYQIACDLTWGYFDAAMNEKELKDLKKKQESLLSLGYKAALKLVDSSGIQNIIGSKRFVGGLVNEGWGHCHCLNLVRGEARIAEKLGAKIFEDARVQKITQGDKIVIDTGHGKVTADNVILAGNAYMGQLEPKLSSRVLSKASYILSTVPLSDELASKIMPKNYAVGDQCGPQNYFRLSADNRLLFGGLATYSGKHPNNLVKAMKPTMLKVFPELKDVAIQYSWGGYSGIGRNNVPQVGRVADNIFYAQAYSGRGVAAAHMSARVIAEALEGNNSRFDIMSSVKHAAFPGGKLFMKSLLAISKAFSKK